MPHPDAGNKRRPHGRRLGRHHRGQQSRTARKPFKRSKSHFADRITADGRDGWPVEAGRYRLVVSRACPWASRALVSRRLLGLEDALSLAVTDPIQDDRSWRFTLDPGRPRPGARHPLPAARRTTRARRTTPAGSASRRSSTCPAAQLVTNDFQQITLDLATEWTALHRPGAPDLYPEAAARGDRRGRWRASTGTSTTGCTGPGSPPGRRSTRRRTRMSSARLDLLSERLRGQRYLVGRHHHRGRHPAVHHAGPLRRRLPRPLQVQPLEADRGPGPVGLRPRPLPDARLRGHRRLRPHQAALLPGAHGHQPDRHRAARARTCRAG